MLKDLKKPFMDYCRMKEEIINGNNIENESFYYLSGRKPSNSEYRKTGGSVINLDMSKITLVFYKKQVDKINIYY